MILARFCLVLCCSVLALAATEPITVPLWPGAAPGENQPLPDETATLDPAHAPGGRPTLTVRHVSQPSLTIFKPDPAVDTGAAVLVCPGGGYYVLAADLEGTEVCEWLNSIGVTGVLLKYRVPRREGRPKHEAPLQDAQRALGLLRHRAVEFGLDPARIGVLGFSAGGHLAAALSTQTTGRVYPPVDAADEVSSRPDFAVLVYPGYLTGDEPSDRVAPELPITADTPPTLLVMTQDDRLKPETAFTYYLALTRHAVPAEIHVYPTGGHGYGLRRTHHTVTSWPDRVADWLHAGGWLTGGR
jgi:acetyl esterase/lipase